jgi:hypothetical protein
VAISVRPYRQVELSELGRETVGVATTASHVYLRRTIA